MSNRNLRCVIYARYSCSQQTEQSIEGQLHDCEKYAALNGLSIIKNYIDRAISGRTDSRPQFQQMISDSKKHMFDVVLVWKLDRFSRDRYDSAVYKRELKKNGVRVMSAMEGLNDSPESILLESMLEGYAEYFSRDLSQKVKRGLRETAKKHKVTGLVPFGYVKSHEGKYEIDPRSAAAVQTIFEMYLSGARKRDIAEYLNNLGFQTAYGNKFTKEAITPLLIKTRYIGKYTYADIEIVDETQRIVSDELFYNVQRKIRQRDAERVLRRCKIYHYNGNGKPWTEMYWGRMAEPFWQYAQLLPEYAGKYDELREKQAQYKKKRSADKARATRNRNQQKAKQEKEKKDEN